MLTVDVRQAVADVSSLHLNLNSSQIARGVSRAINRTLMQGRTVARSAVKEIYTIAQKNLGGVEIVRAYPSKLWGGVAASTKPVPMDAFKLSYSFQTGTKTTISKRGVQKTSKSVCTNKGGGITLEAVKGKPESIPYAFMLPAASAKNRIYGRGIYRPGSGSWGFVRRHIRQENSSGNDAVTPLTSVTIHAAIINPKSEKLIADKIEPAFINNVIHELNVISRGIVN